MYPQIQYYFKVTESPLHRSINKNKKKSHKKSYDIYCGLFVASLCFTMYWLQPRSFSMESVLCDAWWQWAAPKVTVWFLVLYMSQSQPSISWAGLSPPASYQSDFDGHMLPLCLAGRPFKKLYKNGNSDWVNTGTTPDSQKPLSKSHLL